jgi:hypothetical protein
MLARSRASVYTFRNVNITFSKSMLLTVSSFIINLKSKGNIIRNNYFMDLIGDAVQPFINYNKKKLYESIITIIKRKA